VDLIGLAQDRLLLDVPVNSGGQSDKVAAQVRFDFEGLGLVAKARLESELINPYPAWDSLLKPKRSISAFFSRFSSSGSSFYK